MTSSLRLAAGVHRSRLPNGLTVLTRRHGTAPVVAVLTWVRSGYFHERDDQVGLAHVAEHVYFNGTPRRPGPEDIAREIKGLGGDLNAATYYDHTAYHVVLPAENLERALDVQADAFAHPLLDEAVLEHEIGAILQEAARKRDNPAAMAREAMYAAAFDTHRIRRWRMGTEDELRSYRRTDLEGWWADHYRPANAIVAVVGAVDPLLARDAVAASFGAIPAGTVRRAGSPPEPDRAPGLRHVRRRGDWRRVSAILGFRTVPELHPDAAALDACATVLSHGRASRLLVRLRDERQLVTGVSAASHHVEDVGLFDVSVEARPEQLPELWPALHEELALLAREGPDAEELRRARRQTEASAILSATTSLGQARLLAAHEALGDHSLADRLLDDVLAVQPDDVRRVAAAYLAPAAATIVEYVPDATPSGPTAAELQTTLERATGPWPRGLRGTAASPDRPAPTAGRSAHPEPAAPGGWTRVDLEGGGLLVHRHDPGVPAVALGAVVTTGRRPETVATAGETRLLVSTLPRGTRDRDAARLASDFESLGSMLHTIADDDAWGLAATLLADGLDPGAALFFEALREPRFAPEEVDRQLALQRDHVARLPDQPFAHGTVLLRGLVHGEHPLGLPALGTVETLAGLGPGALARRHEDDLRRENVVAAVVGDVALDRARRLTEAGLARVAGGGVPAPALTPCSFASGRVHEEARRKAQTTQVIGFPGLAVTHDDAVVLEVVAALSSSLGGRFFEEIRTRRGLAYVVAAVASSHRAGGLFACYLATAPEHEAAARDVLMAEVERLVREPPDEDELGRAREYLAGIHALGQQGPSAQAGLALGLLAAGQSLDEIARRPARIRAVTRDDVVRVASELLAPDRASRVVLRAEGSG